MICAVALVLLLDASSSIQRPHWELQTAGHADAFEDERLHRVIERGPGIAVTAMAFGGSARELVGWRLIRTGDHARAFADALRGAEQGQDHSTDIGGALMAGISAIGRAPCQADEDVIDLVTDGQALEEPTRRARAYAEVQGIRINAIGVGAPDAGRWLRENAVTTGGFAIEVDSWDAFASAIRSKITMEVASHERE